MNLHKNKLMRHLQPLMPLLMLKLLVQKQGLWLINKKKSPGLKVWLRKVPKHMPLP
jgi:hypothetical protein